MTISPLVCELVLLDAVCVKGRAAYWVGMHGRHGQILVVTISKAGICWN